MSTYSVKVAIATDLRQSFAKPGPNDTIEDTTVVLDCSKNGNDRDHGDRRLFLGVQSLVAGNGDGLVVSVPTSCALSSLPPPFLPLSGVLLWKVMSGLGDIGLAEEPLLSGVFMLLDLARRIFSSSCDGLNLNLRWKSSK